MKYVNDKIEKFTRDIKGKRIAIIGLGVSNIPVIDFLYNRGAYLTVFDDRAEDKINKEIINKYKISYFFGENNLDNLKNFDIIIRSPSCRLDKPEIVQEIKRGAILTSEIEIVMDLCPSKIIGITGSDGKTTTTSLIYEIIQLYLNQYKKSNCYLGGNIGNSLISKIEEITPEDIVILELSSFQLMGMKKSPNIAVLTNISPNHLDIHKNYEEYIEAKKNIFRYQDENGTLVLNYDNDLTRECIKEANGRVKYFSREEKLENGCIFDKDIVKLCKNGIRRQLFSKKDVFLKGGHNFENICAAVLATEEMVNVETIISAIENFKGVEHRLEFVREINGVKWYNDSIGTSPSRTIAGLNSFEEKIVLIAGRLR